LSGELAAARAFLKAGNTAAAIAHAERILVKEPDDYGANWLIVDVLHKGDKFKELEAHVLRWLQHDPKASHAHFYLIICHVHRRKKKRVDQLIAEFKLAFPYLTGDIETLYSIRELHFGSQSTGFKLLADQAARRGQEGNENFYRARMAQSKDQMFLAYRKFEEAFEHGEREPVVLITLAELSLLTLRLGKVRKYAHLTLLKDPQNTKAKELKFMSWAVLFPPFFLGHLFVLVQNLFDGAVAPLFSIAILPVTLPVWFGAFFLLALPMEALGVPLLATALCTFGWVCYMPFIGTISRLFGGGRNPRVRLKDY
jgi:hypothetical protein